MNKKLNINNLIMYHGKNFLIIFLLLIPLVLIRQKEHYFYDPLLHFFENDYLYQSLPEINILKLNFNLLVRYILNSIISIAIIWFFFKKNEYINFSIKFYLILMFILFISINIILIINNKSLHLPLFYTRRFIIQPLFLFLLLPAFHYQNRIKK